VKAQAKFGASQEWSRLGVVVGIVTAILALAVTLLPALARAEVIVPTPVAPHVVTPHVVTPHVASPPPAEAPSTATPPAEESPAPETPPVVDPKHHGPVAGCWPRENCPGRLRPTASEERLHSNAWAVATGFVAGVTTPFVCPFYQGQVKQFSVISDVVQAGLLLSQAQFESDFPELAGELESAQALQRSCLTTREP
jgi:hypothetical protein